MPDFGVSASKLGRIKHLWEETTMSVARIGATVLLSEGRAKKIIDYYRPQWKERHSFTMHEGRAAVLAIFEKAAKANELCPTNREIAFRLNVSHLMVQLWVRDLIQDKLIISQVVVYKDRKSLSLSRKRVITLCQTGLKTKKPTRDDAWFRKKADDRELYAAKNFIRSRGPMVCDASVKYPGKSGIIVDRALYSETEFLDYAKSLGFTFKS